MINGANLGTSYPDAMAPMAHCTVSEAPRQVGGSGRSSAGCGLGRDGLLGGDGEGGGLGGGGGGDDGLGGGGGGGGHEGGGGSDGGRGGEDGGVGGAAL